jgi:hypothetical protein
MDPRLSLRAPEVTVAERRRVVEAARRAIRGGER